MKKLNRKGFTLVELLAVIIILAIVVGISIPAITNIINDSKNNALGVAVDAAENYVVDQYSLAQLGSANSTFTNKITGTGTFNLTTTTDAELIKAMGFNTEDVTTISVTVKSDGGACVSVTGVTKAGQFYTNEYWTNETTPKDNAKNQSKGC